MTSRTAFLLGAALVAAAWDVALYRAFRDASETAQRLANERVNHRCGSSLRPDFAAHELYEYTPGKPLVQPPPMTDPAIARSPITLGGPNRG